MATEFNIKFDATKLLRALEKAPVEVSRIMRQTVSKGMRTVAIDARSRHKFRTHLGKLEKAIKYFVSPDGLEGKVYISGSIAPYGGYVHDGWRRTRPILPKRAKALHFVANGNEVFSRGIYKPASKGPDKFLVEALNRQKGPIVTAIRKGIKRAYKIAGFK